MSVANWADKMIYTAVAQLSSLLLLSLESNALQGPFLEAALESANAALPRWPEPYEDAAHFLSAEDTESSLAPSSSPLRGDEFTSRAAPTGRAPTLLRRDNESDEEEEPESGLPSSRTKLDVAKRKVGPSDSSSEEDAVMPDSGPTRQYCSQACLLGLKKSWGLDDSCPNALSHRVAGGVDTRHPINADEFTCLVGKRLCEDPYRDCRALDGWGKKGAIGVLFRLELAPYGYTTSVLDHSDERNANLLWNAEHRCVMLVDFDRAVLRAALNTLSSLQYLGRRGNMERITSRFTPGSVVCSTIARSLHI
ncbi:unnamed protein product [Clonostachys rosea f. rosea IK726]|uniref:Uncharacterized protein n=1 Tax=Clonostachys rosea f. rosea IK726 TaxID=1349383 RepID=A0ACA9U6J3_BIOOC|nr:unnamed protein product [Clonostachys rosea f. rosea IK726]